MTGRKREPSYRDLDIYHLVIARRWKQKHVANSFGVEPSRVSQVMRRVREWVDACVSDWLFPGQHLLRFLAALDKRGIRIHSGDSPLNVMIEHVSGLPRYSRTTSVTLTGTATPTGPNSQIEPPSGAKDGAQLWANISPQTLTFVEPPEFAPSSAMPAGPMTSGVTACG
jgi:hypothetical protein